MTTPSATGLPAKREVNDDREPVSLELPCQFLTSVTEPAVEGTLVAPIGQLQSPLKRQLTCCLLVVYLLSVGGQPAHSPSPCPYVILLTV